MSISGIMEQLRELPIESLEELVTRATELLAQRREEKRTAFVAEVAERAKHLGIPLDQLIAELSGKNQGTEGRVRRASHAAPIKYRDPHNPADSWSGRGKQPNWLRQKLSEGRQIDEFLVPSEGNNLDAAPSAGARVEE